MDNTLIIIVPLLLLTVFWVALAQLRMAPLKKSTHFGFTIALIVLIGFGLLTMVSLNSSGWLSGMFIFYWIILCVPTGVIAYLLAVYSFNRIYHMENKDSESSKDTREY